MNRLLAIGGIVAILGGLALLMLPGPPIPLLDANRQILAESERQGYCAGEVLIKSNGRGDQEAMDDCIATSTIDDTIDHRAVQPAWCQGILANYAWDYAECLAFVKDREYWPTLKGTATDAWNKRFPYPGGTGAFTGLTPTGDTSRTGDREANERGEGITR